jgi:hypothetical protein
MPFGSSCEFADFDACVAANQDKESPDGYCATLMTETEAACAIGKSEPMKYVYQTVAADSLQPSTELATCTITTINPDREGDRVVPEGGDFSNFMKSPVLMWAHGGAYGYASVPIGSVTALEVVPGQGVKAEWKWLKGDDFADRIKNAWQQGVIRASSIGFKPTISMKNGTGSDIEKWELLELSLCAIPMNPEAVRSLKAMGLIDERAEEALHISNEEKSAPVPEPVVQIDEKVAEEKTVHVEDQVDGEKAMPAEERAASGPEPTPSSATPKDIVIDISDLTGEQPEDAVDTKETDAIESVVSMTLVGVMQGVLAQMHPIVSNSESILSTVTPEMIDDPATKKELSESLCMLMNQLYALVESVHSSAHAVDSSDEHHGDEHHMAVDNDDETSEAAKKPTYSMSSLKAGRMMGAENETKILAAQAHLADLIKALYKEPLTETPNDDPVEALDSVVMNDEEIVAIIDNEQKAVEPTFVIEPNVLRSVITDAVKTSIAVPAMESFQRAINLARGRVH